MWGEYLWVIEINERKHHKDEQYAINASVYKSKYGPSHSVSVKIISILLLLSWTACGAPIAGGGGEDWGDQSLVHIRSSAFASVYGWVSALLSTSPYVEPKVKEKQNVRYLGAVIIVSDDSSSSDIARTRGVRMNRSIINAIQLSLPFILLSDYGSKTFFFSLLHPSNGPALNANQFMTACSFCIAQQ